MTELIDARFEAAEKISARLIKSSLKQSYDPWTDIDWDAPLSADAPFMPLNRTTLYGTPLWDEMTHDQRIQLSRHECSSIASSGIWFEMILMQLVLRGTYDMDPRTAHMHWALTEIADECHHSIMFGKLLECTGMPPHRHSKVFNELGRIFKTMTWGPSSYAAILVAEEILDEAQREMMIDTEIEPLVRQVCKVHVTEESRHIRFAREQIADMMAVGLDPVELATQQTLCAVVAYAIVESLISPGVYAAVGLDTKKAVKAARNNPNLHRTREEWGRKVIEFLHENNLIGGPAAGLWRASHLMSAADADRGLIGRGIDTGAIGALTAASAVLTNVPGLGKLGRGTLAGIGSGPGRRPKPEMPEVVKGPKMADQLRSLTDNLADRKPVKALRRRLEFLPLGLLGDALAPAARPRTKPETSKSVHRLAVSHIQPLTADSVAVTFAVPEHLKAAYRYTQGQHVTIEAMFNGTRVRRNYSICSSVNSQALRIGVKKVPDGIFSSYIVDELKVGDEVDVVPPAGRFYTKLKADNANHYVGIAGGSGITPILSIMASVMEQEPRSLFTLLYGNRDRDSIMFLDEIAQMQRQYGARLSVRHMIEQGSSGEGFGVGRIDPDMISGLLSGPITGADVAAWFICGPAPMTEPARDALLDWGVPVENIHLELFNAIGAAGARPRAASVVEILLGAPESATLTFSFEGAEETVEVGPDELLLDAALRTGQDIPWSCREAVCGMCRAKVCDGRTTAMSENHALTDDEVAAGYVLTCQTQPGSAELTLDFDA